jgi:hypothetical protein
LPRRDKLDRRLTTALLPRQRNRLADGVLSLFLGRFLEADGRRVVKVIDLALV